MVPALPLLAETEVRGVTDLVEHVGTITATWTDPTGVVWALSDTSPDLGWFTPPGPAGWNATTYEIVTDALPRGGEQVRFVRAKPARIIWPLYVYGDSHLAYRQRHLAIKRAFTMTVHRRLTGTLRVARPDGTAREIDCLYEAGFEGDNGQGWLYSTDAITLLAPDGYWRDVTPQTISRTYVPGDFDFLDPFPQVSDSFGLGETEIDNPGDVDAWPTWTITGPMNGITATNITLGLEFTLTYPLAAGEQVTITTFQPQVRGPAGQNLSGSLNWPNAYLWWLTPGANAVDFNVSGGEAGTRVDFTFHPRYEGA